MKVTDTPLEGVKILEPDVFRDARGYFFESYNSRKWESAGVDRCFVQDNESRSLRGVVRGLHYQLEPFAQTKLVRVVSGAVFDVALDLRRGSPTFGRWVGTELSEENKMQMLIPAGFAHGFSVLSADVIFAYKCDQLYNKQSERGIRFNDPSLEIDWHLPADEWIVSEKDLQAPLFADAEINFIWKK